MFPDSIVVSIPACHAGGRGSIPRQGVFFPFLPFSSVYEHIGPQLDNDAPSALGHGSTSVTSATVLLESTVI